ncbi:MAG: S-layer protein [Methylophilaceae bacterium]|nr:S-layer protein [Methylophilaceae bacterium]
MTQATVGWDIGGAHLKAVLVDDAGNALQVLQLACPLWRGLDVLALAVDEVLTKFNLPQTTVHAITMTGELADIFKDRHDGVMQIAQLLALKLTPYQQFYYAGKQGFLTFEQVAQNTMHISSANWLATASFVAEQYKQALLIDMGSTTTDFIVIANGQIQSRGLTDAARLQYDELVYTGMIRTPLMALTQRVPFSGEWVNVAAEYFATTADIYRLIGYLDEAEDMSDTADGKGKTPLESARRLARMIGHDVQVAAMSDWVNLAHAFKQAQLNMLKNAALRQLSRGLLEANAPIVIAGAGRVVLKELAQQLNRTVCGVDSMIKTYSDTDKNWASICLPAYAVANLAVHF